MVLQDTRLHINEYVKGKNWLLYAPALPAGVYVFYKLLFFGPNVTLPLILQIPSAFNFMLHELAHVITSPLPQIVSAAAGSFAEILLGCLLVYGAFKTRSYVASLFCFLWLMLACQSAGGYMADARSMQLELVSVDSMLGGTEAAVHDWNFIFGQLGMLNLDTAIGNTVRAVGVAAGLFGILLTVWLLYKMAKARNKSALSTEEEKFLQSF